MRTRQIWTEAKRLHKLGFAIHYLHSRSKRPIESGWTTGPRKEWKELNETYQRDFNLGVRLGTPSKIGENYLAVVDVDVKSPDPRHLKEANAAVKRLLGGAKCPEVRSGRGNGSRHYYCVTAEPFKTFNPFESEETVKVRMPSKSVSRREREELTAHEIESGYRLSKAWEISLYSDGRQVVLPPSIHPDTGQPYFWKEFLLSADSLPLIQFEIPSENTRKEKASSGASRNAGQSSGKRSELGDLVIDETLDIRWLPDVPTRTRKLIEKGLWNGKIVSDRSAYLPVAAVGLISAGLDQNGVLSVLTDPSTYLGECAYEHAKTKNRERAAQWLYKYTLKSVWAERDPKAAFSGVPIEIAKELTEDDSLSQKKEIEGDSKWTQYLEKTQNGHYRNTFNNCQKIFLHSGKVPGPVIGRDDFAVNDYFLVDTEWGAKRGSPVVDAHLLQFKKYCVDEFGVEFSVNLVNEVFSVLASANRYHPVRDYLKGLEWDGVPRIETWLADFAGATGPKSYLRAVSLKVLVAMVKRVFEPGCKFDHVLILEGLQGAGKSTLLNNLAGLWFSDETLNIGDKDAVLTMQSKWLIELGELSALTKSEVETMKAFISRRTDRIRAPYGKRIEEFPRQCIFIGSTNSDEYLRDETGNRRFWPVKCGKIDFEGVTKIRDQLFAEAYALYLLGEPVYLDEAATEALARIEQIKRGEVDEWFGPIQEIVFGEDFEIDGFEMRAVTNLMVEFGANKLAPWDQRRVGKCLRALGFEKFQEKTGIRRKLWRATDTFRTLKERFGTETNHRQGSTNSPMESDFY